MVQKLFFNIILVAIYIIGLISVAAESPNTWKRTGRDGVPHFKANILHANLSVNFHTIRNDRAAFQITNRIRIHSKQNDGGDWRIQHRYILLTVLKLRLS